MAPPGFVCMGNLFCFMMCHSKSATGPASQGVIKNSKLEQYMGVWDFAWPKGTVEHLPAAGAAQEIQKLAGAQVRFAHNGPLCEIDHWTSCRPCSSQHMTLTSLVNGLKGRRIPKCIVVGFAVLDVAGVGRRAATLMCQIQSQASAWSL